MLISGNNITNETRMISDLSRSAFWDGGSVGLLHERRRRLLASMIQLNVNLRGKVLNNPKGLTLL